MSATAQKETLDFQAEVSQVLNLVIRSLYSNKKSSFVSWSQMPLMQLKSYVSKR